MLLASGRVKADGLIRKNVLSRGAGSLSAPTSPLGERQWSSGVIVRNATLYDTVRQMCHRKWGVSKGGHHPTILGDVLLEWLAEMHVLSNAANVLAM